MSDEETTVETTDADTSTTETGTQETNWEERYKEAQAWGTQASQEAAALRQAEEARRNDRGALKEYLEQFGIDLVEEEDDTPDVYEEPTAAEIKALKAEVEALKTGHMQQVEKDQIAELRADVQHGFATLEATGVKLSPEYRDTIERLALTSPPGEDGKPNIKGAYDQLEAEWQKREQAAASKRRPTHQFSAAGVAGDAKPDTSTHEGRVAHMLNQLSDTA